MLGVKYKTFVTELNLARSNFFQKLWRFSKFVEALAMVLFVELIIMVFFYSYQRDIFSTLVVFCLMVDGFYLLIHLFRKPYQHENLKFDAHKLTIVIACYNGEDILEETIRQATVHVPPEQIIIVSDNSSDRTVEVARSCGVRVYENKRNLQKALSISSVMKYVYTPYVLILDDDTLIGETFIPTSLLDNGYSGVAFKVLPVAEDTVLNKLQQFEYHKSMCLGKSLRGSVGGVGNVSGAIGLFRTKDLRRQVTKHSGQFGGEDQQRTALVHLEAEGTGVTYTDSPVYTIAPNTVRSLYRQRAFRWNLSQSELLFLNLRLLIRPDVHFLLKMEKVIQIYLFFTDPLRILGFWLLLMYPTKYLTMYAFYLILASGAWFKIRRVTPFWLLLIYPLYSQIESLGRFIARFYWFKVKYQYFFKNKYHKLVPDRSLIIEYASTSILSIIIFAVSGFVLIDHLTQQNAPVIRLIVVALASCVLFGATWASWRYDRSIYAQRPTQYPNTQPQRPINPATVAESRYRLRDLV